MNYFLLYHSKNQFDRLIEQLFSQKFAKFSKNNDNTVIPTLAYSFKNKSHSWAFLYHVFLHFYPQYENYFGFL